MAKKNKKWRSYALMAIFILTLCALGKFSVTELLKNTDQSATRTDKGSGYTTSFVLDLGDIESRDYRRMGSIRALLDFSADEELLAVGTEHGEMIVVRKNEPKVVWREKIGIGKITSVKFSADGTFLYVGESSPDGNLFCLDSKTGKKLWQYSSAKAIGADIRQKSLPAVIKIAVKQGKTYALALRHGALVDNKTPYFSKIFCFDEAGRVQWTFPAEGNMDAWVNWFSIDDNGEQAVFGTANYAESVVKYDKNIYALNAKTGKENWNIEIPPILEAKRTTIRSSPNISADGKMVTALASDGRGFVYDAAGRLLWSRTISEPKLVGGVYLNAIGRDAYVIDNYVVFGTLNTSNSANWQMPTPVEHPASNNIVVFDRAGNFISRWQAGGSVEEMAFSYPYAAVAIGRNTRTKDPNVHGLYIYHLGSGQIAGKVITDGPAVAAAVCAQGKSAAVVETPLKLDDGKIIGKYRLIMAEKIEMLLMR